MSIPGNPTNPPIGEKCQMEIVVENNYGMGIWTPARKIRFRHNSHEVCEMSMFDHVISIQRMQTKIETGFKKTIVWL